MERERCRWSARSGEFRFAYGVEAEARKMRQPPGTLALDSMPPPLVSLFRRAFCRRIGLRREWIEPLDELAKALKKCELHSGHYYYREARDCPWCGIESQARVRLFNFLLPGDDRGAAFPARRDLEGYRERRGAKRSACSVG